VTAHSLLSDKVNCEEPVSRSAKDNDPFTCDFASIRSFVYFFFFVFALFFLGNAVLKLHTDFHLVYCIFAIVAVRNLLCCLMAFDCQEIK